VRVREVVLFSILRVLVFAAPFGILYAVGLDWIWAALIAAIVGFCVSYIFLRPLRERVAARLAASRDGAKAARARTDESAEDADF
jgi:uncharacterized membrane protein